MDRQTIVKKLINTYPNSIEATTPYGSVLCLNFVETVDNFAKCIMRDFTESRQKNVFGEIFANEEQCARYLATYLYELREECEEFLNDNYYTEGGELYGYVEDSEDNVNDDEEF